MGQAVLQGNPPVTITLRRSARARRVSLRVSGLDGRVTLTMPPWFSEAEALAFAEQKSGWIRRHLSEQEVPVRPELGGELPFEGRLHVLEPGSGRRVVQQDGALQVPGVPEQVPARLKGFLTHAARDRLAASADRYASALGRRYGRITLRDTRSRWGSCTSAGDLMFSWRLIMAPPEVLDYVAAHEVAHLQELNHSPAYWAVVARLMPGYEVPRRWLKTNGQGLHRYRFAD